MKHTLVVAVALALGMGASLVNAQAPARPTIPKVCLNCHEAAPGNLRGNFENVAFKSRAIQIKIDGDTEIVRFDPATIKVVLVDKTAKAEALRDIPKGREARIEFVENDGVKSATLISFKGPVKIAPEKQVSYEQVLAIVEEGPQSKTVLIDSRPLPRFQDGTIPGAINLPYPAFDKFVDRLPKDKATPIVFFCQGVTCMMSPNSLRRAEAMGYTNAKVYREGVPEWQERNVGVTTAPALKAAFIDKDIPHVLVDVRPASTVARDGFIPGAVNVPVSQVPAALATLPPARMKAPVFVYDGDGGTAARMAALKIHQAGQIDVNVITGGFDAWKAAGNKVATGAPATKIAYAPKPRPGELSIAEFKEIATSMPTDVLILDVRNQDEANAGMLKGAKLVPDEELLVRIGEVPTDKRIVTHCATGVRAEMAYHKLKDKGYKVAFLNADIAIKKNGDFKITPH
jgi:rhodanese-related sulfurtransferase